MPDRDAIAGKLQKELDNLIVYYDALSDEDLRRVCTESEAEDGQAWAAKDHLAHLAMIERAFLGMISRGLDGDANPVGFSGRSRDDLMAQVHRGNEDNVDAHREDDLEVLLADLRAARQETLGVLDKLTDEQLTQPLKGAPWADGTIGGVLITNAYHQNQHVEWVRRGLAERQP